MDITVLPDDKQITHNINGHTTCDDRSLILKLRIIEKLEVKCNNMNWICRKINSDIEIYDNNMSYLYDFYFVRHGQTNHRPEDIMKGPQDLALNTIGIQQARKAGQILNNILTDFVNAKMISSTLVRAVGTAKEIRKITGIKFSPEDNGLNERYFGNYQLVSSLSDIPLDAETETEFQNRVFRSISKILLEHNYGTPLIIVSHQKVFEYITRILTGNSQRLFQGEIAHFTFIQNEIQ